MPEICYRTDEKKVEVGSDETILDASLHAEIPHAHACGGNARCSTCRVLIIDGVEHCAPRNDKEQLLAERLHFSPEVRLACQTTITDDVELRRLVLDAEDMELIQMKASAAAASVGEEKEIAILFADIRGFTSFAETLLPYDVVHALNRYFNRAGKVINRNGGFIDNYMGDGLMALFGCEDPTGAALRAVRAGLELLEEVEKLRPYFEANYSKRLRIGVGVHFGCAVVGAIGAASTKRVTAIGDAVNLASRIESANKQAGTEFLISEDTYAQVKDRVRVGKQARVTIAGKSGEYTLYEVIGIID